MELSDLSYDTEEVNDLIHRFIRFAYDEFQTNGWQQRRIHIRRQYKILDYNGSSNDKEEYTFQEVLERNHFDLDKTLIEFFCHEIKWRGWIDSYYLFQHPYLKDAEIDFYSYWAITCVLKEWIEKNIKKGLILDELKNILGLDICLK